MAIDNKHKQSLKIGHIIPDMLIDRQTHAYHSTMLLFWGKVMKYILTVIIM